MRERSLPQSCGCLLKCKHTPSAVVVRVAEPTTNGALSHSRREHHFRCIFNFPSMCNEVADSALAISIIRRPSDHNPCKLINMKWSNGTASWCGSGFVHLCMIFRDTSAAAATMAMAFPIQKFIREQVGEKTPEISCQRCSPSILNRVVSVLQSANCTNRVQPIRAPHFVHRNWKSRPIFHRIKVDNKSIELMSIVWESGRRWRCPLRDAAQGLPWGIYLDLNWFQQN